MNFNSNYQKHRIMRIIKIPEIPYVRYFEASLIFDLIDREYSRRIAAATRSDLLRKILSVPLPIRDPTLLFILSRSFLLFLLVKTNINTRSVHAARICGCTGHDENPAGRGDRNEKKEAVSKDSTM